MASCPPGWAVSFLRARRQTPPPPPSIPEVSQLLIGIPKVSPWMSRAPLLWCRTTDGCGGTPRHMCVYIYIYIHTYIICYIILYHIILYYRVVCDLCRSASLLTGGRGLPHCLGGDSCMRERLLRSFMFSWCECYVYAWLVYVMHVFSLVYVF